MMSDPVILSLTIIALVLIALSIKSLFGKDAPMPTIEMLKHKAQSKYFRIATHKSEKAK